MFPSFILYSQIENASKSRNVVVHPMLELLLYSGMMCSDADALMIRIKQNTSELPSHVVAELVETVKESVPECEFKWDAND